MYIYSIYMYVCPVHMLECLMFVCIYVHLFVYMVGEYLGECTLMIDCFIISMYVFLSHTNTHVRICALHVPQCASYTYMCVHLYYIELNQLN